VYSSQSHLKNSRRIGLDTETKTIDIRLNGSDNIALIDPANPLVRKPFVSLHLVDMNGSFTNRAGRPYVECEVNWRPP